MSLSHRPVSFSFSSSSSFVRSLLLDRKCVFSKYSISSWTILVLGMVLEFTLLCELLDLLPCFHSCCLPLEGATKAKQQTSGWIVNKSLYLFRLTFLGHSRTAIEWKALWLWNETMMVRILLVFCEFPGKRRTIYKRVWCPFNKFIIIRNPRVFHSFTQKEGLPSLLVNVSSR